MTFAQFAYNLPVKILSFVWEDFKQDGINLDEDIEMQRFAFSQIHQDIKPLFEQIKNNKNELQRFAEDCEALPSNYGFHAYLNRFASVRDA